ncbi:protein of unknown function [Methylocaldum szegediense]|uniref:Uncharacterized protein n=1 Tax=Methylocaldum szegediense TaxID=73780 RepID=A0ABM9I958_9GAMM|nr:protein of unknown function [Methylocaldum szegediense]
MIVSIHSRLLSRELLFAALNDGPFAEFQSTPGY